eukprot:9488112-Pyramimonas_sp.AAC.1
MWAKHRHPAELRQSPKVLRELKLREVPKVPLAGPALQLVQPRRDLLDDVPVQGRALVELAGLAPDVLLCRRQQQHPMPCR